MLGKVSCNGSHITRAPAGSDPSAPSTLTANRLPCVSTSRCRLRPQIFFPRVVALLGTANRTGFDRLAVDDGCAWLSLSPFFLAHLHAQGLQDLLPDPLPLPATK